MTFIDLWKKLDISYDDFIRTTEKRHKKVVLEIFNKLYEKGDIYKGEYEGNYCTPCETFWPDAQVKDKKCPDCGRPTERLKEESYFFKMSKYQDELLDYIKKHEDFIQPLSRRHEIINFVKEGLRDISISRTAFDWGIQVPVDKKHIIYVWIDALTNYISAIGYLEDKKKFSRLWPADLHIMGKDILKFHAIIWPCILLAAEIEPPKRIFAHGWWTVEGEKMSKSKGNVVDPYEMVDEFGVDAFRYFLLREVPFGLDGDFSRDALINRINSGLANDLGNLVSRALTMVKRYFTGVVPRPDKEEREDKELKSLASDILPKIEKFMDNLQFSEALEEIWKLVRETNKYIDHSQPWVLAKDKAKEKRLGTVLYNSLESLRIITILISPFMPTSSQKIWKQLGIKEKLDKQPLKSAKEWGKFPSGIKIGKIEATFPRIEIKKV